MTAEPAVIWRRALVLGGVCVAGLAAVYVVAVWTAAGQRFEDAVLRSADLMAGTAERADAFTTLDAVTVPSVTAAMTFVFLIGCLRRRLLLGFLAVGMVLAAIVTSEVFQRFAQRPILLAQGFRREDQSFPSGHATVAMSLMCALVMVVPYRLRGPVLVLTSLTAAGVGVATVTASWHRPSDTIGADLIVLGCACAAVAVLARCGRVCEAAARTPVGRALRGLLAGAYVGVAVVALAVAVVAAGTVLTAPERGGTGTAVLLAGRSLALSGSAAVAVALLALLRHVDLSAPAPGPAGEGSPDAEFRPIGDDRPSGA